MEQTISQLVLPFNDKEATSRRTSLLFLLLMVVSSSLTSLTVPEGAPPPQLQFGFGQQQTSCADDGSSGGTYFHLPERRTERTCQIRSSEASAQEKGVETYETSSPFLIWSDILIDAMGVYAVDKR